MKTVTERPTWGGGYGVGCNTFSHKPQICVKTCAIDRKWDHREHGDPVGLQSKKNLNEKVDLGQKLEWFSEKLFFTTKFIMGKDPHGTFPNINLVRIFIEKSEKTLQLQMDFSQSSDGLFMYSKFSLYVELSKVFYSIFFSTCRETVKKVLQRK